jgi:hypothetical protein
MMLAEFSQSVKSDPKVMADLSAILTDNDTTAALEEFKKKDNASRFAVSLFPFLLGLGIGLAIFFVTSQPWPLIISLFAGTAIACTVFGTFKNRKRQAFVEVVEPKVMKAIYGRDAVYYSKSGFSPDYLKGLDCFPVTTLYQEDFIKGSYLGVNCAGCDVLCTHTESNGKSSSTVTDFSGAVFSFVLNKTAKVPVKACQASDFMKGNTIEFESIEFNKVFNVYSQDPETAFYLITPPVMEAMLAIVKAFPSSHFTFLFRNQELVLIISGYQTTFALEPSKDLNQDMNVFVDSILPMAYFVSELRLNHNFKVNGEATA